MINFKIIFTFHLDKLNEIVDRPRTLEGEDVETQGCHLQVT